MPAEALAPPPSAPASTPGSIAPATPNPAQDYRNPANPPANVRPGSARERMIRETGGKYGEPELPKADPKPAAKAPEVKTPSAEPSSKTAEEPAGEGDESTPSPATTEKPENKKQNPWKLYREEKERATTLERQLEEFKSKGVSEEQRTQEMEKFQKLEARNKELEQEIRFRAYEKSDEYKSKYEKPYEDAWTKHMHELNGVTVAGDDGATRPMQPQDILDLVNLSLPDARNLAKQKWGDFAEDAMAARKEIRTLFDNKLKALDEARKTGDEREKTFQENAKKWREGVQKRIKETWDAANQVALSDPVNGEFFKPVEGDETRNQILGKGFALVDKAFAVNTWDPKLTDAERAEAVKLHAAVRNRAAAFGPLKYAYRKALERIRALEKSNGQFKDSEPPAAGGTKKDAAPAPTSAKQRMIAATAKYGG